MLSFSAVGVVKGCLSLAAWMMTCRVKIDVRPALSVATVLASEGLLSFTAVGVVEGWLLFAGWMIGPVASTAAAK
jgi:hypothetical protein